MLSLNKLYKNKKGFLTIHCKYKYFNSTVQRAEDRRQKFYFCRLPFAVNVKLNLSNYLGYTANLDVTSLTCTCTPDIWIRISEVIYQTRATVFHRATPRRQLKIRRAAEYF